MKFCWENSGRATCGGAGGVSELVSELVSERGEGERRRVRGGRCRGGASVAGLLAERTRVPGAVVTLGDKPSTRKPIPATLEAAIAPAIAWAYSFIKKMIPSAERGAKRESSRAERHHIGRTEEDGKKGRKNDRRRLWRRESASILYWMDQFEKLCFCGGARMTHRHSDEPESGGYVALTHCV